MTQNEDQHNQAETSKPQDLKDRSGSQLFFMVGIGLAVIGMALSLYSVFHHIELRSQGVTDAACNINQTVSCDQVAASSYAEPFGIPMGVFGIGYFGGIMVMLMVALLQPKYRRDILITYKFLAGIGVLTSIVLFGISTLDIGAICLICIGVYSCCLGQALIWWASRADLPTGFPHTSLVNGASYPGVFLMFSILVYSFVKPENQNHFTPDLPQDDLAEQMMKRMSQSEKFDIPISRSAYAGLGEDYRKGPDNAKVTIVEFADYQCPACRNAYESLKRIESEMGDRVQVVFRNYPLDSACNSTVERRLHEWACDAAILTRCAGRQGKFWQMHDIIYENQSDLNGDSLIKWAKSLGLSDEQIKECRSSQDIMAKIRDDVAVGNRVAVTGTPSLYINGHKLTVAPTFAAIAEAIEGQLE